MNKNILIAVFCLAALTASAQYVSETLSMKRGWNAMYLESTPEEPSCDAFFADVPVTRAVKYMDDTVSYYVWEKGGGEANTLTRLVGGSCYLIYATEACKKTFLGIPVSPHFEFGHGHIVADGDEPLNSIRVPLVPGQSSDPFDSRELAQAAIESGEVGFFPTPDVQAVLTDSVVLTVDGYKGMFAPIVYPSDDKWRVMYELTAGGTNALERSVHAVVTNLDLAAIAAAPEAGVDLSLKGGVPGFYYTLFKSAAVTNVLTVGAHDKANGDRLCDKDGIVALEKVTKPSDTASFFTICVSPEQLFTVGVDFGGAIVVTSPIITEWEMIRMQVR